MGSRRGPEQTIGQQNFKMKFLLVLCLLGLVAGSEDYKMFMKWAKTKAMESCWGEDNMKIYTVNMKKAVAKCNQQDAPELDLPPFRAITRMINNLVGMAGHKEDEHHEMESFMKFYRYMQMMNMMNHDDDDHHQEDYSRYKPSMYSQMKDSSDDMNMMEQMKMMMMMKKMKEMMDRKENNYESYGNMDMQSHRRHDDISSMFRNMFSKNKMEKYEKPQDDYSSMESMFRSMGKMRYKRQADDSLALNDRLKEKLEHMMKEHVEHVSNMTCVLREMNVIDQNNNIDVKAMKKDAEQYKLPSTWFGDRYEEILESCHQVAENLPASLQDKVLPNTYNGPMRNLAKIKSFMNCCKTAKMKIETNFGPVDQLLEGFNNQITEEQVFYMVN